MSSGKSLLAAELEPLQEQIEQTEGKLRTLEGELQTVADEIESFSEEKQRFDALRDVCTALDKLEELGAGSLFWDDLTGVDNIDGYLQVRRERISLFEEEIRGTLEKHEQVKAQIARQRQELNFLHEEVRQAYAREERRGEELLVEREVSSIPFHEIIMPWSNRPEDDNRYRKALLAALAFCFIFGSLIPLWNLPKPDRTAQVVVPKRLAMLVKKELPKPAPLPKQPKEKKEEKNAEKEVKKSTEKPKEQQPTEVATANKSQAVRKKIEGKGVLAFKKILNDMMDETPVAKLGAEARLSKESAVAQGQARPSRSLIAMQAKDGSGGSGGIGNAGVSRNIGSGNGNRIGGVGFTRVASSVEGLAGDARPLSSGPGPGRTDEEIQIVFDRYKASLYRLYNSALRRDPTLRGKMILRLTIEPGGEVSLCMVQSTDLDSKTLVAQIVERVRRFNFGEKDGVPSTTILYPIDFLPRGSA